MASLSLLVTDYVALSKEAGRRHSEVRDAADKAAQLVKSTPRDKLMQPSQQHGGATPCASLYDAVFLAPATKNAKVIALAVAVLQRLVTAGLIPTPAIAGSILDTLEAVVSQGVDSQLKVLQTLVTLLTTTVNTDKLVQGEDLGRALELSFRLTTSKIAVVSSTASATLRQLFMFIFERVEEEDALVERSKDDPALEAKLPKASFSVDIPAPEYDAAAATEPGHATAQQKHASRSVLIRPAARDAYLLLEDLCLLIAGTAEGGPDGEPSFLKWHGLSRTFGLELVESIVSSFVSVVRSHAEIVLVLRAHLCPLLTRFLSSPPGSNFSFPLTLRLTRVIFLLLKNFANDLPLESEVFLSMFVRVIGPGDKGEGEGGHPAGAGNGSSPVWMRILALEIARALCTDFDSIRRFYERYDQRKEGSKVVYNLLTALNRLATEKPTLLGTGASVLHGSSLGPMARQEQPVSVIDSAMDIGFGIASVAGTVVGSNAQPSGLVTSTASMRVQCIDQLDKADPPPIPETYPFLLALQSLCLVAEGFANRTLPLADQWKRKHSKSRISWADESDKDLRVLRVFRAMAEATWPALLAALSFYISTALDDDLFEATTSALENLTKTSGALELDTPREAFLTTICKFSVPAAVVSELATSEAAAQQQNRNKGVLAAGADALGLTSSSPVPPGLSSRNLVCLRGLINVATYLAGSLGTLWHNVFETLLQADFVLRANAKKTKRSAAAPAVPSTPVKGSSSAAPSNAAIASPQKGVQPTESEEQTMQAMIAKLFDVSKALEDDSFTLFIEALCQLSRELVTATDHERRDSTDGEARRSSISRSMSVLGSIIRKDELSFPIQKIGMVSHLNLHRLVYRSRSVGWDIIVNHLLFVAKNGQAPSTVRTQAAEVLDQILVAAPKNISSSTEEVQKNVQTQILAALGEQTDPPTRVHLTSTDIEIRRMAYGTLLKILEVSGHSFKAGWSEAFRILRTACQPGATVVLSPNMSTQTPFETIREESVSYFAPADSPSKPTSSKTATLVRTSFPSLQLICTDLLEALSPDELRVCIETLAEFGKQVEDVNVALTAGGLLWTVSDHLQSRRDKSGDDSREYNELYMFLLLQLLTSARDDRQEVRDGSVSTIFRSISLYGSTFSSETWQQCMFDVVFPLVQSISDASQRHALASATKSPSTKEQLVSQPDGPPIKLSAKQWDDSKVLALRSMGEVFSEYPGNILASPKYDAVWSGFVEHVKQSFFSDHSAPTTAAMLAFERVLSSLPNAQLAQERLQNVTLTAWSAWLEMGDFIPTTEQSAAPPKLFSQVNLEAFVRTVLPVHNSSAIEFSLERIKAMLKVLRSVLTYGSSSDHRPDIDALSSTQQRVMEVVLSLNLDVGGAPSAVLSDLADYMTLAFVPQSAGRSTTSTGPRATNVALAKIVMPKLVELFGRYKDYASIYTDGAVERVLCALALPMKLKYDCPAPSKYGSDDPLWKTATVDFLTVVRDCFAALSKLKAEMSGETFEAVWRQIIEAYRGAILADVDVDPPLSLDARRQDENFDLCLLVSVEQDVLPHIGDSAVPPYLTEHLAKCLQRASRLYKLDLRSLDDDDDDQDRALERPAPQSRSDSAYGSDVVPARESRFEDDFDKQAKGEMHGTTADIVELARERFAYWSFDLLYLMCSERFVSKRIVCLALPAFVNRCAAVIRTYLADAPLRGKMPFPRIRQEELVYVLRKLNELELTEGAMLASLSADPASALDKLPALDATLPFKDLLRSALLRSRLAHLYELYPLLTSLLSLATKAPSITSAFVPDDRYRSVAQEQESMRLEGLPEGFVPRLVGGQMAMSTWTGGKEERETDVVQLTLSCLHKIGQEMGAGGGIMGAH